MTSNIEAQQEYNSYQWRNLTSGKLMCIHMICAVAAERGNSIAEDICCEIEQFAGNHPETGIPSCRPARKEEQKHGS